MRVVECSGTPTQMGEATGETLREEIREHLTGFPMGSWEDWERRAPGFVETLSARLPHIMEELITLARGADVEEREILRLNLPLYPDRLSALEADTEGCTNFAFANALTARSGARTTTARRPTGRSAPACSDPPAAFPR